MKRIGPKVSVDPPDKGVIDVTPRASRVAGFWTAASSPTNLKGVLMFILMILSVITGAGVVLAFLGAFVVGFGWGLPQIEVTPTVENALIVSGIGVVVAALLWFYRKEIRDALKSERGKSAVQAIAIFVLLVTVVALALNGVLSPMQLGVGAGSLVAAILIVSVIKKRDVISAKFAAVDASKHAKRGAKFVMIAAVLAAIGYGIYEGAVVRLGYSLPLVIAGAVILAAVVWLAKTHWSKVNWAGVKAFFLDTKRGGLFVLFAALIALLYLAVQYHWIAANEAPYYFGAVVFFLIARKYGWFGKGYKAFKDWRTKRREKRAEVKDAWQMYNKDESWFSWALYYVFDLLGMSTARAMSILGWLGVLLFGFGLQSFVLGIPCGYIAILGTRNWYYISSGNFKGLTGRELLRVWAMPKTSATMVLVEMFLVILQVNLVSMR